MFIVLEDLIPSEYKSMKKVLICNFLVYELAKSLKTFDHVIPINLKKFKENIFYRVKTISYIISIKSKIVIQPTYSRYFDIGDTVVRVSGGDQKIGFDGDNNNQKMFLKSGEVYKSGLRIKTLHQNLPLLSLRKSFPPHWER